LLSHATQAGSLPPRADVSEARRRLYEAAIDLFADKGFYGASVRDLAAALGQQPGALYGHVASKQQLLFELVLIGQEEHREWVTAALLDAGPDPREQLAALVRAHVLVHLHFAALARVTNRENRALSPEQRAATLAIREDAERMFVDVIERGIRKGEFVVQDLDLVLAAIGAMAIRAAEWWTPDSPHSADHVADTYAQFALQLVMS
jgi:AcrR family transcriptional regulator